jgi:hypothetical protein
MNITVVYNKKTNKIIEFSYGDFGEIILEGGEDNENNEDIIVSKMDINRVDLYSGYVLGDENG